MNSCGACRHAQSQPLQQSTAKTAFPRPVGYINDFANLLTETERSELSAIVSKFKEHTTHQLAVATIESFRPYPSIDPYATDLFNEWGIGSKEKNDGVLLLVAIKDRAVRIEVGKGLEPILTNEICKGILRYYVPPNLRAGAYGKALKQGLNEIIRVLENQPKKD